MHSVLHCNYYMPLNVDFVHITVLLYYGKYDVHGIALVQYRKQSIHESKCCLNYCRSFYLYCVTGFCNKLRQLAAQNAFSIRNKDC